MCIAAHSLLPDGCIITDIYVVQQVYYLSVCMCVFGRFVSADQVPGSAGAQPNVGSSLWRSGVADPDPHKWLCDCEAQHSRLLDMGVLHQSSECAVLHQPRQCHVHQQSFTISILCFLVSPCERFCVRGRCVALLLPAIIRSTQYGWMFVLCSSHTPCEHW